MVWWNVARQGHCQSVLVHSRLLPDVGRGHSYKVQPSRGNRIVDQADRAFRIFGPSLSTTYVSTEPNKETYCTSSVWSAIWQEEELALVEKCALTADCSLLNLSVRATEWKLTLLDQYDNLHFDWEAIQHSRRTLLGLQIVLSPTSIYQRNWMKRRTLLDLFEERFDWKMSRHSRRTL